MVLAVVHDDAHVLQRIAGDRPFGQHLAHAFLDRRNELVGDRAADHLVDELESRAARQRLDSQVHLAELARAAGLLLVAAMAFRPARDGLAIGNARRMRLDVHAVALGHALEHHAQVQLAHAVEHGLVQRSRGARHARTDPRPRACAAQSESRCSSPRRSGSIATPSIGGGKAIDLR